MKEKKNKKNIPLKIQVTEDMANWMHPQNKERKTCIFEKTEEAKKRYRSSKKQTD